MAVQLEYVSVIVPISNIARCRRFGGFEGFIASREDFLGMVLWHDEHLLREGAMNPSDARGIVHFWADQGLQPTEEIRGERMWKDLCVVDLMEGPTLPCPWIEWDKANQTAWLKGSPKGETVGPWKR
jgi:hypothetical protein